MGRSRNRESSAERPDPNQQRSSTRPLTLRMEARSSTRRQARGPGRIRQTDQRLPTTALDKRPTSHGSPERERRAKGVTVSSRWKTRPECVAVGGRRQCRSAGRWHCPWPVACALGSESYVVNWQARGMRRSGYRAAATVFRVEWLHRIPLHYGRGSVCVGLRGSVCVAARFASRYGLGRSTGPCRKSAGNRPGEIDHRGL